MENFINSDKKNTTLLFTTSTDNKKWFNKNLKKMPLNWEYRNKSISYVLNEQGFREKPFEEVNWKNAIVLLGCSIVFGEGLAVENTISKQLELLVNRPVVNLGIRGSAVDLACWNSLILHQYYPTPKAVIQVWSAPARYTDFDHNNSMCQYFANHKDYYHKLNWRYRSKQYMQTDRVLWKNKTVYYEISFLNELVDFVRIFDKARDLSHPGINSAKTAAEKIAENLYKQGL